MDAEVVEAGHRPQDRVRIVLAALGRDEFQQQFVSGLVGGFAQGAYLAFLRQTAVRVIVRIVEDQALDDLFRWPVREHRADRTAELEDHRVRSRPLDRTPEPPTAPGGGVQGVFSVAIVDQRPDAAVKLQVALGPGDGFDEQAFQFREAFFRRADLAREVVELAAMVECEDEDIVPRPPFGCDVMQPVEGVVVRGFGQGVRMRKKILIAACK